MPRKLNVYWLKPPALLQGDGVYIDTGWMNFRSAAPDHTWVEPIIDWDKFRTVEDVVQHVVQSSPDVLCLSTYMWNVSLCHDVAAEAKRRLPHLIVVVGGPHQASAQSLFDEYPHVDYRCFPTGHGEYFIKPFLDQVATHGDVVIPEEIPYLGSRTYEDVVIARKFAYPSYSVLEQNYEYLLKCATYAVDRGDKCYLSYETTRGCPYGCTYCEWGGGISAKVGIKSMEVIERDLAVISTLGIATLEITDANFGILDRDVKVAEMIANISVATGSPSKVYLYGIAKTTIAKRARVVDVLGRHGLMREMLISMQTISSTALKNIDRTDVPLEDNVEFAKRLKQQYGISVSIEMIMGLPGYTIDDFYAEYDTYQRVAEFAGAYAWSRPRYLFMVLPGAPAADPAYLQRHKIRTVRVPTQTYEEPGCVATMDNVVSLYECPIDACIETYSYTVEDWKLMYLINRLHLIVGPMIRPDVKASDAFRLIGETLATSEYYQSIKGYIDGVAAGIDMGNHPSLGGLPVQDHMFQNFIMKNLNTFGNLLDVPC